MSELLSPALKTIHKLVPFSSYSSMYSPILLAYITDLTTRHWPFLPLSLCQGSGTFFSFPSTFLFQTAKIRRLNGQGTVSQCPSFRETSLTHQSFCLSGLPCSIYLPSSLYISWPRVLSIQWAGTLLLEGPISFTSLYFPSAKHALPFCTAGVTLKLWVKGTKSICLFAVHPVVPQ